jgi:hypothetical protein
MNPFSKVAILKSFLNYPSTTKEDTSTPKLIIFALCPSTDQGWVSL